jgi:hypothetical protein
LSVDLLIVINAGLAKWHESQTTKGKKNRVKEKKTAKDI